MSPDITPGQLPIADLATGLGKPQLAQNGFRFQNR
jgi:hypothetical protein